MTFRKMTPYTLCPTPYTLKYWSLPKSVKYSSFQGILRCPPGLSLEHFIEECIFYEIPDRDIKRMLNHAGILPQLSR